ncbi:MAG: DUF5662 family protein [Ruminococcus sp.]|nr:DUF5662 family protein [Ruminococcus sp.]
MNKVVAHFTTVCKHKYYVGKYCFKCGLPLRGLKHDLSKFSPTEFVESVKYFQGNRSPIDRCKEVNGYSKAWQHHKGRNSHHYEYWVDNLDNGGVALMMPFKDACELICDYLGAGHAYMKDKFSYAAELDWWRLKAAKPLLMHPHMKEFITKILTDLTIKDDTVVLNKKYLKTVYDNITRS